MATRETRLPTISNKRFCYTREYNEETKRYDSHLVQNFYIGYHAKPKSGDKPEACLALTDWFFDEFLENGTFKKFPNTKTLLLGKDLAKIRLGCNEWDADQVQYIYIRHDAVKNEVKFHPAKELTARHQEEELDFAWIELNFNHFPDFMNALLDPKNIGNTLIVPVGSILDVSDAPERIEGAPDVVFGQGSAPICLCASLASACMYKKRKSYHYLAEDLISHTYDSWVDIMDLLRGDKKKTNVKERFFYPKVTKNVKYSSFVKSQDVKLILLKCKDGSQNHAVGACDGWIFDSNLPYALPHTIDTFDWLCSRNDGFDRFCKVAELRPLSEYK